MFVCAVLAGPHQHVIGEGNEGISTPYGQGIAGITKPFREAMLAPVVSGRLSRILVSEGQVVREDDLIFSLDDHVQRARTEMAKAAAESTLDVDLARARWERAKRNHDRLVMLYGHDSASSKELTDARAETDIHRIDYERAEFLHTQAVRAHQREQAVLNQFHVRAPFAGYVFKHFSHAGESVDENENVVAIVQLNPLLVSIDCPLPLATMIHAGDRLWVHPADVQWAPKAGTVVLASRVADGASQTFRVKLSVDNTDGAWMAGLKVRVRPPATGHREAVLRKVRATDRETNPVNAGGPK